MPASVGFGVGVGVTGGVELFAVSATVLFAGVGSISAKVAVADSEHLAEGCHVRPEGDQALGRAVARGPRMSRLHV